MTCKNRPDMTYVFGGTLNLAQSINQLPLLLTNNQVLGGRENAHLAAVSIYLSTSICSITNHTAQQREKTVEHDRQG